MEVTKTASSKVSDKDKIKTKDIPTLFPYQIKRREHFYFRDHPKNLNPKSPAYKKYWLEQIKYYIEGRWINDEGTWVFMMPKLCFFINYAKIYDEDRRFIHPRLRDIEWIIFTYFLCLDGFSGFEGDEEYTCHYAVKEVEDGKELSVRKRASIPENCKTKTGAWKKFIDPWYYLTRHYLIDSPAKKPLGQALYDNPRKNGIILSGRGMSKDNRWDTIVYKEDGPCMIKDVNIGDKIYGADGKLTTIVDKATYNNQMQYKITFDDGRTTYCGDGHLWEVYKNGRPDPYVMPLKQIRKYYLGHKRKENSAKSIAGKRDTKYFIKVCEPIEYPQKNLPIDPYFLGLWLGDGTSSEVAISTIDQEIKDYVYKIADEHNLRVRSIASECDGDPNFETLRISGDGSIGGNFIKNKFKKLNLLNNKHIPHDYIYSSVEQRMELVRGFMDTDGTVGANGGISVVQKNKKLIDQLCMILGSLGIKYKKRESILRFFKGEKLKEPRIYYKVLLNTGKDIFKLTRKRERLVSDVCSDASKRNRNKVGIRLIEPVGVEPSICLGLDNEDKLFVCDDYIVTHNSMCSFVGDFTHEFLTGGIKRITDLKHINAQLNFGMGCADARQLERSVSNIKSFYENMPGQYEYEDNVYMGPLYKKLQGTWDNKLQHIVKRKDQTVKISGSLLQMVTLTPDRTKVGAGDRFRRIYVEEVGFLKNMFEVHRANKDSMIIGGKKVGSAIYIGTGGDLKTIQEPKAVFERVDAYDIFGIPNYWKNLNKKIGLFIPAYYASEDYKDKQGNTLIKEAYNDIIERREKKRREIDADSYESEIMFNPVTPDEMLRPSGGSILPKQAAAKQLDNLETFDIFRNRAMIGDLNYNALEKRGVDFKKDLIGAKKPILRWEATAMETNSEGAVIIYEQPGEIIPEGLYYVIFDPVQKSGSGTSYNSVLVYKNFYRGPEESLYDTIVAEWLGRKERLEDNYHMVIKMAKYFNAKIFPETNVAGFVEWCNSNNYYSLLEPDATFFLKQEVNPNGKRNYYRVGYQMQTREKTWALRKLRDWLLETKRHDPVTGIPVLKTMDWIFSPRILEEILGFSEEEDYNYDHISSLLGLMILIGKLGKQPVDLEDAEEKSIPNELEQYINLLKKQEMLLAAQQKPQRSKFLQY